MGKKRKYTEQVVMFEPTTLVQLNEITDELEISNSEFIRGIVEDILNEGTTGNKENNNEK